MSVIIFYFCALAFTISLGISGFMVRAGVGDLPDHRSSHSFVTPTSGGLGVLAGLSAIGLLAPYFPHLFVDTVTFVPVLVSVALIGFMGAVDDVRPLYTGAKFVAILLAGMAVLSIIQPVASLPTGFGVISLPPFAGYIGSLLWIFVVTNVVNFMDGINGMMVGVMSVALAAFGICTFMLGGFQPAILCCVLASALMGLAPYNFRRRAQIFAGDVGALTVGFGYSVAVLWAVQTTSDSSSGASLVYVGPVLILPFLCDSLMTLLGRARRKSNILAPHREHLYQRWVQSGRSHPRIACAYTGAALLLALWSVWGLSSGLTGLVAFISLPTMTIILLYLRLSRRVARKLAAS